MDLSSIFNWPGITLCVSAISAALYFIEREIQHKKTARFDIALSKIYTQLERFIVAANKVRVNINTMPLDFLLERKSKDMDEWITYSIMRVSSSRLRMNKKKEVMRAIFENIKHAFGALWGFLTLIHI